jgi:hypothetical protein
MKVRSNILLPFTADRAGIHYAIIEIDFRITNRNSVTKMYTLIASDFTINDALVTALNPELYPQGRRQIASKVYEKSYAEFDMHRSYFLYMDESGLTGSDLEDKLLQDVLLYNAMTDTIYSSGYEDWDRYSDPVEDVVAVSEENTNQVPLEEQAPRSQPRQPVLSAPVLLNYINSTVSGTSIVGAAVFIFIDFEGVVTTQSVVATMEGTFEHTFRTSLPIGATITALVSNSEGENSNISNLITVDN